MKNKKLIAGAALALALSMGSMLVACGGGTAYTFEAEKAKTEGNGMQNGQTPGPATLQEGVTIWSADGSATETVGGYSNFNGVGQKIIWTVVADKDASGNLTLHAATNAMTASADWSTVTLASIDFSSQKAYKLTCNDEAVALAGTLPETPIEGGFAGMANPSVWWHMGTVSGKVKLKAGENKIVLEIIGTLEGAMSSGINVDKIVITSPVKLTEKE